VLLGTTLRKGFVGFVRCVDHLGLKTYTAALEVVLAGIEGLQYRVPNKPMTR